MSTKNKWLLALGITACGVAIGGTTASVLLYYNHDHKEHKQEKPEDHILKEEVAINIFNLLVHNGIAIGRANMLINYVNNGQLQVEDVQNIYKTTKKEKHVN